MSKIRHCHDSWTPLETTKSSDPASFGSLSIFIALLSAVLYLECTIRALWHGASSCWYHTFATISRGKSSNSWKSTLFKTFKYASPFGRGGIMWNTINRPFLISALTLSENWSRKLRSPTSSVQICFSCILKILCPASSIVNTIAKKLYCSFIFAKTHSQNRIAKTECFWHETETTIIPIFRLAADVVCHVRGL
jgi:hypothetical protein